MVLDINDKYEVIHNLYDVMNVIRKYYNKELAIEMDRLVEMQEDKIEELEYKISEQEIEIEELKDKIWVLEDELEYTD